MNERSLMYGLHLPTGTLWGYYPSEDKWKSVASTDTFDPARDLPSFTKYWAGKVTKVKWNGVIYEVADWVKS